MPGGWTWPSVSVWRASPFDVPGRWRRRPRRSPPRRRPPSPRSRPRRPHRSSSWECRRVRGPPRRRMFAERGLFKCFAVDGNDGHGGKTRLRWQAEQPNALWHGGVCHGPTLTLSGRHVPVRVHLSRSVRQKRSIFPRAGASYGLACTSVVPMRAHASARV